MKSISKVFGREIQSLAIPFGLTFICIFLMSLLAGVSTSETLNLSLVVSVQVCTGSTVWRLLRSRQICTIPEILGMGLAIGSTSALLSNQILRTTPLNRMAWVLPSILLLLTFFFPKVRNKFKSSKIERTPEYTGVVLVTAPIVALAYSWWWLLPIVPVPFLFKKLLKNYFLKEQVGTSSTKSRFDSKYAGLYIPLLMCAMITLALYLRSIVTIFWISSYDQVFSESLSVSITTWGPSDNIFRVGEAISYHWFSLGWAGMTTQAGGIGSWTIITKLLPICSWFGATCLAWSCAYSLSKSKVVTSSTVFFLVLASTPVAASLVSRPNSPTFIFSIVWLLAFTFILIQVFLTRDNYLLLLLGIFLFMSFGSKVSGGAVALGGTVICVLTLRMMGRAEHLFKLFFALILTLATATILIYFFMYRHETLNQGSHLSWGFGMIAVHSGLAQYNNGISVRYLSWLGYIIGSSSLMAPLLMLVRLPATRVRPEPLFFLGAAFASQVLTSIFSNTGSSEIFFFLGGMIITSAGVGWALGEGWLHFRHSISGKRLQIALGVGLSFGLIRELLWDQLIPGLDPYRFAFVSKVSLQFGLWFVAIVTATLLIPKKVLRLTSSLEGIRFFVMCTTFMAASVSIGLVERYQIIQNDIPKVTLDLDDPNLMIGSRGHNEALTWLRTHSNQDDIVATNRFCIPYIEECLARWYLVSALSHRRLLIEEGWGGATPDWAVERVKNSIEFTENPSKSNANWLIEHGVTWVFVDYAVQKSGIRNWEPFGKIAFSNKICSIVRLSPLVISL